MKEIGGYIEFENFTGDMLHGEAIHLNCGRNALVYLIRAKNIKKLALPFYLCNSVANVCKNENVEVTYYHINERFLPVIEEVQEEQWIYIVNYFGQISNDTINRYKMNFSRIIVDNAQSYFQMPVAQVDTIYTCRKYFGVSDGAILYTDALISEELAGDESFDRMRFLLGRYERTASEFYDEYVTNNKLFSKEPMKMMSKLTENLLRGIDYEAVKKRRTENYCLLHEKLNKVNCLELCVPEGAFAYPLYVENSVEIKRKLVEKKIYIPTLWPNVLEEVEENSLEYEYALKILPLPCDQRYGKREMAYIVSEILE